MAKPLDLDAYLGRINYTGPRTPTYDDLTGILQAHIASIPFESFDVLLGRPIRLDPEGLQAKIVTARRGGYCFEHASLMYAALERIGFAPVRHASRVLLFEPRHEGVRQHMFVTITISGATYVIDLASAPSLPPSLYPLMALPSRRTLPPTASSAKVTIGFSTSPVMANKSKAGFPPWRRSTPSISR
jgi:N-hydroxyarylamine O-acetyltransferase